ncbi:MAG: hypothetical protein IT303_20600 [Dehalococcoidia bacterium]|nr:hypothetical protein [Dehalococcoidia bacterium]
MFHEHNVHLDMLVRSNYQRFVHPGDPQPEWVRRAAEQHQELQLLRADRKAASLAQAPASQASAPAVRRPGLLRRVLPLRSRA